MDSYVSRAAVEAQVLKAQAKVSFTVNVCLFSFGMQTTEEHSCAILED